MAPVLENGVCQVNGVPHRSMMVTRELHPPGRQAFLIGPVHEEVDFHQAGQHDKVSSTRELQLLWMLPLDISKRQSIEIGVRTASAMTHEQFLQDAGLVVPTGEHHGNSSTQAVGSRRSGIHSSGDESLCIQRWKTGRKFKGD